MRRKDRTFRPWLETLEDRLLPTCSLTLLDSDANGSVDKMAIVGDEGRQLISLVSRHDRTTVQLDCNGDGDYSDAGDINRNYQALQNFDIQLAGGDDDFYLVPDGTFNNRNLNVAVDLGSGNDNAEMNDVYQTLVNSHLRLDIHAGDGDDWVRADDLPWIQSNSTWDVNIFLGTGNNRVRLNSDTEVRGNSTIREYVEGSPLVGDVDTVYVRLNTDVLDTSVVTFEVALLGGSDTFEVEVPTQFNEWGGEMHLKADGGSGNDTMTVWNWEDIDGIGMDMEGLFDVDLKGGAGDDTLRVDLTAGDGLELDGEMRVRLDGGDGGDQLTAAFRNTDGSVGNYDVALWGGAANDILTLALDDAGAPFMNYNSSTTPPPNNFVLLDGGDGTSDKTTTTVTPAVPLRILNSELGPTDTVVTIKATDPTAAETFANPGTFTVTRSGPTTAPLVVPFTVGGTATPGTAGTGDYLAISGGTVTIPAGATTATITVVPRDDLDIEGQETVIVTLASGPDYFVGTPSSATVRITDDDPSINPTFIPTGATWKYLANGTNQGTAWRAPAFNDSTWPSAPAQFGYGDGDETTVVPSGRTTYYFRRAFTVNNVALITQLNLRLLRDDGAVVYLNGTEVYRTNMPGGTISYNTWATTATPEEGTFFQAQLNKALLVNGTNWLAVEVHQASNGTVDISFDASLTGTMLLPTMSIAATDANASEPGADTATFTITRSGDTTYALPIAYALSGTATNGADYTVPSVIIPAGATSVTVTVTPRDDLDPEGNETIILTLSPGLGYTVGTPSSAAATLADDVVDGLTTRMVTPGSVWKYLDNGSNQGTAWRAPAFDDTAWNSGQAKLGFGSAPSTTLASGFLTYYFRKSFSVTDPSQYATLKVRLLRDDGGVVYLNGTEILRSNMPAGNIVSTTRATAGVSGADENTFFELDINPALLVNGTNVLAVEIHQVVASSPDLGFDLELIARQPTPAVTVTATDATASEPGADTGTLTFTRTGPTATPMVVTYTVSGTAASSDYSGPTGTVTIAAGSTSATVTVTASNDTLSEDPESVIATVVAGAAYLVGTPDSATITILDDNDPAIVTVTAGDNSAAEAGADPGSFTFTRNGAMANALTVHYSVGGTAAGGDYDAPIQQGTVTIPAGIASATVVVTPVDDAESEIGETVIVNLTAGAGYVFGTPQSATITILDNDLPTVNVAATDASAAEAGPDTGTFTFTRNGPTTNPLTVTYTLGGTASSGDYTGPTGTVTIPAGSASVTVTVTPVNDALVETTESVSVTLNSGGTYFVGPSASASIGIQENRKLIAAGSTWKYLDNGVDQGTAWRAPGFNDAAWPSGPGQLGFGDGDEAKLIATGRNTYYYRRAFTVVDRSQYATLKVRLLRDDGAVVYLNGTEVFRSNMPAGTISYATIASSISIADENQYFEANINAGLLVNGTNVVAVEVHQAGSGSTVDSGFDLELLGTLLPATVSVAATDTAAAEAGQDPGTFTVTRSGDTAGPLVVAYTLGGTATSGDYTGPTGTVTIPAGSASATVTVTPQNDTEPEDSESVLLTLNGNATYSLGTPSSATVTITDNDPPTVTVTATDATAAELGQDPGTLTLTRTGPTGQPLSVSYTVGGTALGGTGGTGDYPVLSGVATFAAGSATATITVTPHDDLNAELEETAIVTLSSSPAYLVGASSSATVTIVDNDTLVTVAATDADAAEVGTNPGAFTVTRAGDLSLPLTVTYTVAGSATGGSDYDALPGTATFAVGSATAGITVTPHDDLEIEAGETVIVTLSPSSSYALGTASTASVTIVDNDTIVGIAATDGAAAETGNDPGTFTITRAGDTSASLTVAYTVDGTAGTGDYNSLAGTATFAAGQAAVTVTVTPHDDAVVEDSETVSATLSPNSAYTIGASASATVNILDNDTLVSVAATDAGAAEAGADPGTFTLTRTGNTTQALTVAYTVGGSAVGGTAGSGDYEALSGTAVFGVGQDTITLTVTPRDDLQAEDSETVSLTLSASTGYTLGASSAAVSILDNDTVVTVAASDAAAAEAGPDTGSFTLTRAGNLSNSLTIAYTVGGSAVGGTAGSGDYEALSGSATFAAGQDTITLGIMPHDDLEVEGSETASVTLSGNSAYTLGASSSASVSILDNDTVVTVVATDADAAEAGTDSGVFTLTRAGNTAAPLTVTYTVGGTAAGGPAGSGDYEALSGTATFAAGQDTISLAITPHDDLEVEGSESASVALAADSAYTLGASSSALVSILDNDTVVTVAASDAQAAEVGSDTGAFTLTRVGNTTNALTIAYTVGGTAVGGTAGSGDYEALSGTATFDAGSDTALIVVTPHDDAEIDENETVILTLSAGNAYTVGAPASASATILDNDIEVSIAETDASVAETTADPGTFTLTRRGNLSSSLAVGYTVSGSAVGGTGGSGDYQELTGSVIFDAGSDTATIAVTPVDDSEVETSETVVVTLSPGTAYNLGTSSAMLSIVDDDSAPVVSIEATDAEASETNANAGTLTLTRVGQISEPLSVDYTLSGTAGSTDYEALSGTVTFAAGSATATITITPQDDLVAEPSETVVVTLSAGSAYTLGAPDNASVSILDNDTVVTIEATDASAAEAGTDAAGFTFTRTGDISEALSVAYTVGGTAGSGDYDALSGTATFAAGSATTTITVVPHDDSVVEDSETVVLSLATASGYTVGSPSSATVNIQDNDVPAGPLVAKGSTWKFLDTGTNQGTAWQAPAFDDSAWTSGLAQLGFGEGDEQTLLASGRLTYYFRHAFTVADASAVSGLTLRLLRDDGAVVYLNGSEVLRSNMPTGPITYLTKASSAVGGDDEKTFFETNLSAALLVTGTNVLSVEIHQSSASSSDLSFDLELLTTATSLPTVSITAGDATASEVGTDTGTFTITRTGDAAADLTVTYSVGGSAAGGTDYSALSGSVTIPAGSASTTVSVTPADDSTVEGSETVSLTLSASSAYTIGTAAATVTILDDDVPPVLANVSITASDATASEPGTDTGTFTITRTGDTATELTLSYSVGGSATGGADYGALSGSVTIAAGSASATVTVSPSDDPAIEGSETVILTVSPSGAYTIGNAGATVTILDNDSPPGATTLVATGSTWKYLDNGTDQGTAWRDNTFDDSTWSSGAGPLGYGMGGEGTVVSFGPNPSQKYTTTYFRHGFTVADATTIGSLNLRLRRDDGAVVYLNGVEVVRSNMPTGALTYLTRASSTVSGAAQSTYFEFSVDPSLLVTGSNVLTVEVHQSTAASSDLIFDLGLTAT